jgi:outer membrane lipoprotein LolB
LSAALAGRARRALLALAAAVLAGCTTAPKEVSDVALSGRLVVQVAEVAGEPAQQFSAGFELRGHAQSGELDLLSPLGTVVARARWHAGGVQLATPSETYRFRSPADLSRRLLGEPLPLEALFDWLRGRAWAGAPHVPAPKGFEQVGWQVDVSELTEGLLVVHREGARPVRLRVRLESPP